MMSTFFYKNPPSHRWVARYFLFAPITIPLTFSISPLFFALMIVSLLYMGLCPLNKAVKNLKIEAFPRRKLKEPGPTHIGPFR